MKYDLLIIILFLFSCKSKNIFQDQEIVHVTQFPVTVELTGQKINLVAEGILALHLIDTFIIVSQRSTQPEYIALYGKKSLCKLKSLLPKGRGSKEFMDFTFKKQYTQGKNGTEIYFSDINKSALYALNLTKSLQHDSLVVKHIAKIPYPSFPVFLTDSFYLSRTYIPEKEELAYLLHDTLAHTIHKYPLYKNINSHRFNQMGSVDQIKPDLSKIAMGMIRFNQINILDLKGNHHFSITTSATSP